MRSQFLTTASMAVLLSVTAVSAQTYTASFTLYGSAYGSPNCNSALHTACGFYTYPGYSAAVSANLYGAEGGQTGACATCYSATVNRDVNDNPFPQGQRSILVMVDNVCPSNSAHCASGHPCETGGGSCNDWGMDANFDLCDDSGAGAALLGPYGVGAAKGWVTVTDCANWYAQGGQVKTDAGSGKRAAVTVMELVGNETVIGLTT